MQRISCVSVFVGLFLVGCFSNSKQLGTFSNRVDAEKAALAYLAENYHDLPDTTYKLYFDFEHHNRTEGNAFWYDKKKAELAVEVDLGSGQTCGWQGVDNALLNRLIQIDKGFILADSLAKPIFDRGYHYCY